jgi:hypothetical protein
MFVLCVTLVALVSPYPVEQNYSLISAAIRHWDFRAVPSDQPREFWGVSYVSAALASVTGLSDRVAVVVIAFCMYVLTIFLGYRLWGATLTAWFVAANWWWLESTVDGGSEPLFMALLLGAFLAVRKERWILAAALASGATVVRPVGIFALLAIEAALLLRRDFRRLAIGAAIGAGVGVLYVIPMVLIYGNALASVQSYRTQDWASSSPVTFPLVPIIRSAMVTAGDIRLPLKLLIGAWVLVVLAGVIKLAVSRDFRIYAREHIVEAIFFFSYSLFLFSYNANVWAWQHFPRFAIPVLPFVLLAFHRRLPSSKWLLCGVAAAAITCVVLPKAGMHRVAQAVHYLIERN